jgi:hypothetical protein
VIYECKKFYNVLLRCHSRAKESYHSGKLTSATPSGKATEIHLRGSLVDGDDIGFFRELVLLEKAQGATTLNI